MLESLKHEDLQFQELSPEEKQARGILARLTGPIASFTKGTRNGRKYSDKLWEKAFDSPLVKEMFKNGGLPGELQHPENRSETDPTKIAIMMPEPPKKDNNGHLVASVDILDTPCGQIAYQLGKYGFKFGISSRGEGDLIQDFSGEESVDPDTYTLNAFDLVLIPACEDARLQFNESLNTKKSNKLRTILSEALENASDTDRKIMEEALDELNIDDNWRYIETYHDDDIYYDPDTKKYVVGDLSGRAILNSLKNARAYIDRYGVFEESILTEEQVGREETKPSESASNILRNKPENTEEPTEETTTEVSVNVNDNTEDKDVEVETEEDKDIKEDVYDGMNGRAPWDTDFHRLDVAYHHNFKQFKDREKESGMIQDFVDELDQYGKDYDIYEHTTDPGITIFFQESLNEAFDGNIEDIDVESILPTKKDIDRAKGLKFRGHTFRGNGQPFGSEASKMAKLIKDPIKLVRRAKAVVAKYGADEGYMSNTGYYHQVEPDKDSDVWGPFKKRLIEFGFTPNQISSIKTFTMNESLNEDILWDELNGTEQSAAEAALASIKNGSKLEDAVHGAVTMYNDANSEEEYEDEEFYGEEADYTKVLDYVKNHTLLTEAKKELPLFVKMYDAWPELMEHIMEEMGIEEDEYPDMFAVPEDIQNDLIKEFLDEVKNKIKYEVKNGIFKDTEIPTAAIEILKKHKDEILTEAKMGMFSYVYAVHAYPEGRDITLGGSKTIEGITKIGIEQAQKIFENPWMTNKEKYDYLDTMYISNDDTEEIDVSPEFDNYVDELMSELSTKLEEDNKEVESLAADNDGALVEQLQKILKHNKSLEDKVKALQEKISVGYAKEIELKEELDNYKQQVSKLSKKTKEIKVLTEKLSKAEKILENNKVQAEGKISTLNESIQSKSSENKDLKKNISNLNEAVDKKNSKIRSLNEQIAKYKDQLSSKDDDIEKLKEQYETGQKDLEQVRENYSKKLEQQNQIIEKYRRVAKSSVKRYVESQAIRLGVKSEEIVNRLPKNYSFNDIDRICEDLQEYKFNMSNLPFNSQILNENIKINAKNINNGLIEANPDDEITDYDLKVAEAFL